MTLAAYDWISYHAANTPDKRAMYDLASGRDYSCLLYTSPSPRDRG